MSTDAAIAQALEALFDGQRVTWNGKRPAPGTEPGERELYVGVGSRDASLPPHPRMLSWKLAQWRGASVRSTTEVVMRSAVALDALTLPITVTAHEPTLDTVCAVVLATYRVLHRRWPESVEALVDYVADWESGRTTRAGPYETALASVFYASAHLDRGDGLTPPRELATLVGAVLGRRLDADGLARLPRELISADVSRRLKADIDLYRTELSRGWKVPLDIPLDERPNAPYRRIDALFLSSPQDVTVLKLLARPDTEASSYRRGFELMAVHAPNEVHAYGRHTITLSPESPGTLGQLGVLLDRLEGPTAPDGNPRRTGQPRFTHQPAALEGLADPWYSDAYALQNGRSTLVAPPFVGTRLSREQIWEAIWEHFNVGRNIHLASARTLFARPFRALGRRTRDQLLAAGWRRSSLTTGQQGLLPSVASSFLGDDDQADVVHLEKSSVHVSLYPSDLAVVWVERVSGPTTLYDLAKAQAAMATGSSLESLEAGSLLSLLEPVGAQRWLVYGAYRINRARSTMIDQSRAVLGLLHALASGSAPTLAELPSEAQSAALAIHREGDVEHWFTATGGARLELRLDDAPAPPDFDQDFALFLLTAGQRYAAFEIIRRMAELERRGRTSRWAALKPTSSVRGDVMFFINSLWYSRISDDPDLDTRYDAWRELHGMGETVEALRSQAAELDEYRKERFESMVGLLVFVFLPITIVCGFFSGAQFSEMDVKVALPWSTGGWKVFLIYTGVFTAVVFGTLLAGRVLSFRRR